MRYSHTMTTALIILGVFIVGVAILIAIGRSKSNETPSQPSSRNIITEDDVAPGGVFHTSRTTITRSTPNRNRSTSTSAYRRTSGYSAGAASTGYNPGVYDGGYSGGGFSGGGDCGGSSGGGGFSGGGGDGGGGGGAC